MNPLEQLKDIHVPPQVSAWPPAYGWWLVALVCILAVAVITFVLMKRRRFNSAKREALIELSQISSEQTDWPIRINTLLKRVCLRYFPNEQAANLHTSQWQDFYQDNCLSLNKPLLIPLLVLFNLNCTDLMRQMQMTFSKSTLRLTCG